ncbi:MAG: hypothetical protein ACI33S_03205 [Bacilli bacterium]
MSNIKMDIQLFGGGGDWSEGITVSAVDAAYDSFSQQIDAIEDAIRNYSSVDTALSAGWSGVDCQQYLDKFHQHTEEVCTQIEEYRVAVKATVEDIKSQWEDFQANLIS